LKCKLAIKYHWPIDIRSGEIIEDNENDEIDANDIVEVIDLDEAEGEDEEELMEDEEEVEESTTGKLPEDNSNLVFNKHGS